MATTSASASCTSTTRDTAAHGEGKRAPVRGHRPGPWGAQAQRGLTYVPALALDAPVPSNGARVQPRARDEVTLRRAGSVQADVVQGRHELRSHHRPGPDDIVVTHGAGHGLDEHDQVEVAAIEGEASAGRGVEVRAASRLPIAGQERPAPSRRSGRLPAGLDAGEDGVAGLDRVQMAGADSGVRAQAGAGRGLQQGDRRSAWPGSVAGEDDTE